MKKIVGLLSSLVDFSRPRIREMDVLDIVVENHALLMLTFRFQKKYTVKINRTGRTYRMKEGTLIVKLPAGQAAAEVRISNLWRSRTEQLILQQYRLDDSTAATLMNVLFPFNTTIYSFPVKVLATLPLVSIPAVSVQLSNLSARLPHITINQEQLTYDCNEQGVL